MDLVIIDYPIFWLYLVYCLMLLITKSDVPYMI